MPGDSLEGVQALWREDITTERIREALHKLYGVNRLSPLEQAQRNLEAYQWFMGRAEAAQPGGSRGHAGEGYWPWRSPSASLAQAQPAGWQSWATTSSKTPAPAPALTPVDPSVPTNPLPERGRRVINLD